MHTRRPCRGAAPTHPFVKRQIALACTWTLLAGIGTGAALAQGPTAPVALKEVTVSATAETPESLPAAAPGGQVARAAHWRARRERRRGGSLAGPRRLVLSAYQFQLQLGVPPLPSQLKV